ncbi:hypothetical protein [Fulvivirga imtechensis]|uniref:hypothetical protein n=1 Tax=Fulvivirga imtechensis TaxID=881893 RepID=UPI00161F4BAD|nr:hypothetical protein [Fulvivirga imtechensis]
MLNNAKQILKAKGYLVYQRPWQLNIVAFRSRFLRSNAFDDWLIVFYRNDGGKWVYHHFPCTTDPGQYWLDNPMHPKGTAFLKANQYVDSYAIGFHKASYEALVQVKPVTVIRDYDRGGLFNWFSSGYPDTGLFGINVHRATANGTSVQVDSYSAGCIVLANSTDFAILMKLARVHKSLYGNRFTLTLIDYRDRRKRMLSTVAWGAALASTAFMGYQLYNNYEAIEKYQKGGIGRSRKPGRIGYRQMAEV